MAAGPGGLLRRGGGGRAGVCGHGHALAARLRPGHGAGHEADPAAGEKCWGNVPCNSLPSWSGA